MKLVGLFMWAKFREIARDYGRHEEARAKVGRALEKRAFRKRLDTQIEKKKKAMVVISRAVSRRMFRVRLRKAVDR
jgi:hypothetical protein